MMRYLRAAAAAAAAAATAVVGFMMTVNARRRQMPGSVLQDPDHPTGSEPAPASAGNADRVTCEAAMAALR